MDVPDTEGVPLPKLWAPAKIVFRTPGKTLNYGTEIHFQCISQIDSPLHVQDAVDNSSVVAIEFLEGSVLTVSPVMRLSHVIQSSRQLAILSGGDHHGVAVHEILPVELVFAGLSEIAHDLSRLSLELLRAIHLHLPLQGPGNMEKTDIHSIQRAIPLVVFIGIRYPTDSVSVVRDGGLDFSQIIISMFYIKYNVL